jgi:hypothetical protein
MNYPPQIEALRSVLSSMPGVAEVGAEHTALDDFDVAHLSLVSYGDLPHAAIRRSQGGLPGEALGQVMIRLSPSVQSWRTLEFLSWQVRDWSRGGRNIQIRARGLPPVIDNRLQLGSSLLVIIEFFVDGLDEDPMRLLRTMEEFGDDLTNSMNMYGLDWRDETIQRKAE